MALEQMLHHNLEQMYVVERDGKLVGIVKKNFLEEAIRQGSEDLSSVMLQNFPKANANISLENIFHFYQQGQTVAVVDGEEKFKGVVEASDILTSISNIQ
jgi:glycine betaine/proline transport system ATP-binding protein